jgi:hypothetical protein
LLLRTLLLPHLPCAVDTAAAAAVVAVVVAAVAVLQSGREKGAKPLQVAQPRLRAASSEASPSFDGVFGGECW